MNSAAKQAVVTRRGLFAYGALCRAVESRGAQGAVSEVYSSYPSDPQRRDP
jgi:hypothetical protein